MKYLRKNNVSLKKDYSRKIWSHVRVDHCTYFVGCDNNIKNTENGTRFNKSRLHEKGLLLNLIYLFNVNNTGSACAISRARGS